ncbi:MAG: hypothetical protein KDA88_20995, partial [Planctomycetaceae bacterium]|nr:hypothetical protein [Planctomycetaceae bacterium]
MRSDQEIHLESYGWQGRSVLKTHGTLKPLGPSAPNGCKATGATRGGLPGVGGGNNGGGGDDGNGDGPG